MNAAMKVVVVAGAIGWMAAPASGKPAAGRPAAAEPNESVAGAKAPAPVSARPAAGQTRTDETGEVTFTLSASAGEVLLVAEAPGIVFEKRSTADSVTIRVAAAGDAVRVDANQSGDVRLTRGRKSRRIRVSRASVGHVRDAQEFLAGSTALLALEGLAARLAGSQRPEADSVLTSYALIEAVQGRSDATRALAGRHRARVMPVAGVRSAGFSLTEGRSLGCWDDYRGEIMTAWSDYEACLRDVWWGWAPCSFEYTIRAEGAWFGYISCSGGLLI
jgi:hypothetical protein